MTKRVRVENADTANSKVIVEVWDKGYNGQPDTIVRTIELLNPCDLANDSSLYLTSSRYLIVKEG